jgi:hypothetical protein
MEKLAVIASETATRSVIVFTDAPGLGCGRPVRYHVKDRNNEGPQRRAGRHVNMSLSSTSTIKGQLTTNLGLRAPQYFDLLKDFVAGRISRQEFDDAVRRVLDSNNLST